MADIKLTFTEDDLFLLEMAIDEVLWRIENTNNPTYKRYKLLDDKIYSARTNLKKCVSDVHISELHGAPIEDLDFSIRTYNCLKRASINTIGDLLKLTPEQIENIKNMTKNTIREVNTKISELSVS